jgi:hypothetical protein
MLLINYQNSAFVGLLYIHPTNFVYNISTKLQVQLNSSYISTLFSSPVSHSSCSLCSVISSPHAQMLATMSFSCFADKSDQHFIKNVSALKCRTDHILSMLPQN